MAEDAALENLLEKIKSASLKPTENCEFLRSLTSKLRSHLTSQDAIVRQAALERMWRPNSGDLVSLMSLLEVSRDVTLSGNLAAIVREVFCIRPAQSKPIKKKPSVDFCEESSRDVGMKALNVSKKIISLTPPSSKLLNNKKGNSESVNNIARTAAILQSIQQNSTAILIRIFLQVQVKREPNNVNMEFLLYDIIWILSQISQKDPKFPLKARMLGAVKVIHNLLKLNMTNSKILFPLLNIMKQLAKHPITTAILLRDGIVTTYEKIIASFGYTANARMKLCLDAINFLSRNKNCCVQLAKAGVIHILLRIFEQWEKYDGRNRVKICSHVLQTLQHVTVIKSGRRIISLKKHVQILHRFCTTCPNEEIYDRLIGKICSIICLCVNNKILPVPVTSPAVFNLTNELMFDAAVNMTEFVGSSSDDENDAEDESLLSNYNSDASSDSENLNEEASKENFKDSNESLSFKTNFIFQSSLRGIEDLKRYNMFFREFGRLQKQLRLVRSGSKSYSIDNFLSSDFDTIDTSDYCTLRTLNNIKTSDISEVYTMIASQVKSVIPFVKVPYPCLYCSEAYCEPEYLNEVERTACRKKLITCIERAVNPDSSMNEVVFDMDSLCSDDNAAKSSEKILSNNDVQRLSYRQMQHKRLEFESRFESGNLRKVIQIGPKEYDLILMPDVNSSKRHLWFFFEVSNMTSGCSYTFNIVNCEKSDSQFNFGMKPVMYSVREAISGRSGWVRTGSDICYYRNSYQYTKNKFPSKSYLTVTFTIDFPHSNDVCYLAYHFPYTYSQMMTKIWKWSRSLPTNIYFRAESLCTSLNNNEIPLLTITAQETPNNMIQDREIIFLSSRVHPGESNSSWVMEGTLRYLLEQSPMAAHLRSTYVFKIVPMLNIEGVINGW